ncbi:MAG: hypothetical protein ACOX5J_02680 [Candidatus Hydrogenedentales bacterium]|jgi:hypothetical protein
MNRIWKGITHSLGESTRPDMSRKARLYGFIVATALLCLMSLSLSNRAYSQARSSDLDDAGAAVPEKYKRDIVTFLKSIPDVSLESARPHGTEQEKSGTHSKASFILNSNDREKKAFIQLDAHSGLVVSYLRFSNRSKSESANLEKPLACDEAFALALPILRYYNLSTDAKDYRVAAPEDDVGESGFSPAEWTFSRNFSFGDIPFRHSGIWLSISASSGLVRSVKYVPITSPSPLSTWITKEEAIACAQQYLLNCKYFVSKRTWLPTTVECGTEQVIAIPNEYFASLALSDTLQATSAYYCWEVPFEWEMREGEHWQGVLWITMASGEPIGGDAIGPK